MTTTLLRAEPGGTPLLRRWWVWVAGLVVVVLGLGWLLLASPVLGATTVTVRGEHTISAAAVRGAAHIPRGTPLLRLSASAVAARVENLPAVASAHVSVSYPSTVVITVQERVAVGYVGAPGDALLIDATGRQYETVSTIPAGLPRFELPTGSTATATGQAMASVAGALPRTVISQLAAMQALNPQTVTLLFADGRVVLWGPSDRNAQKAQILPALLGTSGTQFDLTDPDAPIVR